MTTAFILDHIPRKMAQLGFGNYEVRMITENIPTGSAYQLNSQNIWTWIPMEHFEKLENVSVESGFGYLLTGGKHNRQQYEHTGIIIVQNKSPDWISLTLIQAIPVFPSTTLTIEK